MEIKWGKLPQTQEEIIVAEHIEGKISILEILLGVHKEEKLLSISFTPPPLKNKFYTYEIKYHKHEKRYFINVWKGITAGDTMPVIYGYLND